MSKIFCRLKAFLPITSSNDTLHFVVSMTLVVPLIAWTSSVAYTCSPYLQAQYSKVNSKAEKRKSTATVGLALRQMI